MALTLSAPFVPCPSLSPLVLADRLLSLAQEADGAGYREAASRMVDLVFAVMEDGADRFTPSHAGLMPAASVSH